MKYVVTVEGETFEVEMDRQGGVKVNGEAHHVDLRSINDTGHYSLLVDGRSYEAYLPVPESGEIRDVTVDDQSYRIDFRQGRRLGIGSSRAGAQPAGSEVRAPLPGLLVEVSVAPGQSVGAGQVVAVLESMKMNLELRSPAAGVVADLSRSAGEEVSQGTVLMRIAWEEERGASGE
jgi:biotin carboxyl carrier protein